MLSTLDRISSYLTCWEGIKFGAVVPWQQNYFEVFFEGLKHDTFNFETNLVFRFKWN